MESGFLMKRFVEGEDRRQGVLLPEFLDDYVAEDNPVRAIDVFVDELDLRGLGFEGVVAETTGRPAYHPATMLKIYVYGYVHQIQSSRRLERETARNVEMMWLTGRLTPDFKTIADFRRTTARRPQARHRREVRCRLSSPLCRKAPQETGLLPHQCAAPSSSSRRADRRGFQKNFPRALKAHVGGLPETTPVEIWFEDEARIGQKNGQVRQWSRRGTRPRQPADQRYDNAYLFGAIGPARGVGAALVLPYADADMMQLHLDEISRNVAEGAHAVLLLDRAGWHTTGKLDVPDNITPIFLPSRAPELNPVENVWQYLRQNWLSNTIFENYDAIVDAACAAWRKLIAQPETITSIGMRDWAHLGQTL